MNGRFVARQGGAEDSMDLSIGMASSLKPDEIVMSKGVTQMNRKLHDKINGSPGVLSPVPKGRT